MQGWPRAETPEASSFSWYLQSCYPTENSYQESSRVARSGTCLYYARIALPSFALHLVCSCSNLYCIQDPQEDWHTCGWLGIFCCKLKFYLSPIPSVLSTLQAPLILKSPRPTGCVHLTYTCTRISLALHILSCVLPAGYLHSLPPPSPVLEMLSLTPPTHYHCLLCCFRVTLRHHLPHLHLCAFVTRTGILRVTLDSHQRLWTLHVTCNLLLLLHVQYYAYM